MQNFIPHLILTKLMGILANSKNKMIKSLLIRSFIKLYKPAIEEALVSDVSKYPTYNQSVSQKLLAKNVGKVITHNWDLGQNASKVFSENFYKNNPIMKDFKQFRPSEYGGYMDWGDE